ncbi:MAG TPA: hypothetical protein PLI09_10915 [Candidatus Hydrogenedentes bacterium]|nr:hypothetical protein [Candidatus Hydrogenedentota bacterium]
MLLESIVAGVIAVVTLGGSFETGTDRVGESLRNVTLEMSLKPFKQLDEAYVEGVCGHLFEQWRPLLNETDQISVLLWTADGSEILDYAGRLDDPIEWARYIGTANSKYAPGTGPESLTLHERPYLYMDNPPEITYSALRGIVAAIKRVGRERTGKTIRVGATFDPGPEFAKSPFKYERHPEICLGSTMGKGTFVCCYGTLHGDTRVYAGYPEGIREGTPFGAFFGRQTFHFLKDLDFDYIWFSNGFGFGLETWSATGAVFDGERFDTEGLLEVRDKILEFWRLFREECPDFPIETRGSNLMTGSDLAANGVPLRDIYRGGFGLEPPPNSPWAALDGDFGLEMAGYMSRIAELPGNTFPFRYYIHDPWWLNSPWLDRYGREPHDIYLPMSVARIDEKGQIRTPTSFLFLTVDNSFGEMPDQVPIEVLPHLLSARRDAPDAPGPCVWIYPFDECHDWTFAKPSRAAEAYFGDWFMRQAINHGFPLNTVVSTGNFVRARKVQPGLFAESVLICPVPDADTALETALLEHVRTGGRALLYGPIGHAGAGLLDTLDLRAEKPIEGEVMMVIGEHPDRFAGQGHATRTNVRPLLCGGGAEAMLAGVHRETTKVLAECTQESERRVLALWRQDPAWNGGMLAWLRGVNSNKSPKGVRLPPQDSPVEFFPGEVLARYLLSTFGYSIGTDRQTPAQRVPLISVARHDNGFYFSGYTPDTTVRLRLRFPQGAPILLGYETALDDNQTTYSMPRAWHRECRMFVDGQTTGTLSLTEQPSGQYGVVRRWRLSGLTGATVRFYPPTGTPDTKVRAYTSAPTGEIKSASENGVYGRCIKYDNIRGTLTLTW